MIPRWLFLRALGLIYFSAFYSLLFQIKGLIGPDGIEPAGRSLAGVAQAMPGARFWYAPSLFWISSSSAMLMAVMWIGIAASLAAVCNLWPRLSLAVCWVCFLSFVTAAGEFSNYQSDGMLLEAGFLALFFAPRGILPGWGANSPPSRASLFLLQWEWFRIYFESGLVKMLSGDEQWRHLTAMDEYYQNGPLPTWIGWYVEHLPHWFHAATAAGTLGMELGIVWMLFLPRRLRLICFLIVTPWEIGVILTANYTFLNYLVLSLGVLLLDDRAVLRVVPQRWRPQAAAADAELEIDEDESLSLVTERATPRKMEPKPHGWRGRMVEGTRTAGLLTSIVMLTWIGYATSVELLAMVLTASPLPVTPVTLLEPLRIANQYGLFAVMTRGRYEIEFQGSRDGQQWTPYLFRYKPQALNERPGIYAPYQPRFEWNLWFASLGDWQQDNLPALTEERLLQNDADVLSLFRRNPFAQAPPKFVRAVLWQYWFTSLDEKRRTGNWWRRQWMGVYAPVITRAADGRVGVVAWPDQTPPHD